jgi:hypothetical protein
MLELFGVSVAADRDLPVASLTRLADTGEEEGGWWLRADPVHLHADAHQVLMYDARQLRLDPVEVRALVTDFNRVFSADGLSLDAPHPERWYLRLEREPGLRTHTLVEMIGRDVNGRLPWGRDARRWRRLLTEVQMLFHGSRVNHEREARGLPTVNGIWLWGGGFLPELPRGPAAGVYAVDPLVLGLARRAGLTIETVPDTAVAWWDCAGAETDNIVVLEHVRYDGTDDDIHHWGEQIELLERDWFSHCRKLLADKTLDTLYLYPCNGWVYSLRRSDLRRFWRRTRPLAEHL